jgi:3-dehydroquinate dehydratase-2
VSLHDAIKAMPFPVVEVHMSNLAAREEWRHRSTISPALKGTVLGLGWRSYTAALRALAEIIAESQDAKRRGLEAAGRSDQERHTDWT